MQGCYGDSALQSWILSKPMGELYLCAVHLFVHAEGLQGMDEAVETCMYPLHVHSRGL